MVIFRIRYTFTGPGGELIRRSLESVSLRCKVTLHGLFFKFFSFHQPLPLSLPTFSELEPIQLYSCFSKEFGSKVGQTHSKPESPMAFQDKTNPKHASTSGTSESGPRNLDTDRSIRAYQVSMRALPACVTWSQDSRSQHVCIVHVASLRIAVIAYR